MEEFLQDVILLNKGGPPWKTQGFPNYSPDGVFQTGPLEQVFPYLLYVGTVEELIDCIPDREIISVSEHFRNYQSGKVSKVKGILKGSPFDLVIVRMVSQIILFISLMMSMMFCDTWGREARSF